MKREVGSACLYFRQKLGLSTTSNDASPKLSPNLVLALLLANKVHSHRHSLLFNCTVRTQTSLLSSRHLTQKCAVLLSYRNAAALLSNIIVFSSGCALFGTEERTLNTEHDEWKFMVSILYSVKQLIIVSRLVTIS